MTFSKRLKNRAELVANNSKDAVRKASLSILAGVVPPTPVDTGRARSNWQVEIDAVPDGVIDLIQPEAAVIAQGSGKIGTYGKDNHTVVIANNLPYIGRLNDGWSAQAPAGFIEAGIEGGLMALRNVKFLGK